MRVLVLAFFLKNYSLINGSCLAWREFWGILLGVARVLGDFSPRTPRPSVALVAKGSHVYFVL